VHLVIFEPSLIKNFNFYMELTLKKFDNPNGRDEEENDEFNK
jgi:hypothetical protein